MRVGNRLPEHQGLVHLVAVLVFHEALVVAGDGDEEQETVDVFEAVNPLFAFGALAADVEHAVGELAEVEDGLGDARGAQPRAQEVLVVGDVVDVPQPVKVGAEAGC